jgi:hypothetical protein
MIMVLVERLIETHTHTLNIKRDNERCTSSFCSLHVQISGVAKFNFFDFEI